MLTTTKNKNKKTHSQPFEPHILNIQIKSNICGQASLSSKSFSIKMKNVN